MAKQKGKQPIEKVQETAQQAVRAESAPAPVRRYRAVLFRGTLVVVAVAFAVLTVLVKSIPSFAIDVQITLALQAMTFPPFALLMRLVSWPGYTPQSTIIAGTIILLILGLGLRWEALMALIAVTLSTSVDVLIKDLIQRPRPTPSVVHVFDTLTSFSFPSGHVMFYVVFFGFILFLTFSLLKPSLIRSLILAFSGALVVLVGCSRIYLGEHWPSDVLGAYLLASLILVAVVQLYIWGMPRFFVRQPVAADSGQRGKK
jgi:membrane-associated phospholipid phosphatase